MLRKLGPVGFVLCALVFAAWKHRNQVRKADKMMPYVFHPIGVARLIYPATVSYPDDVRLTAVVIALFHDLVEDTKTTLREIECWFGADIAAGVDFLTNDPKLGKVTSVVKARAAVAKIKGAPDYIRLIRLADKLDSLDQPPGSWSKFVRVEYLRGVKVTAKALGQNGCLLTEKLRKRIRKWEHEYNQEEGTNAT